MKPLSRIRHLLPGLTVAVALAGALAGCGPHIQCADVPAGNDCERIAEAAIPEIPAGADSVTVDFFERSGTRTPVVACYPDGTAVAVGVTLTAGGADVAPWTGKLPFTCP